MEVGIGKKKSLLGEALEIAYEKYNGIKDKAVKITIYILKEYKNVFGIGQNIMTLKLEQDEIQY